MIKIDMIYETIIKINGGRKCCEDIKMSDMNECQWEDRIWV
jgi:hypothetical protein